MRLSAFGQRRGRAALWLLVGLLIGGAVGAGAVYVLKRGKAGLPGGPRLGNAGELALVPSDSAGFIHVRARDIWKLEHLEQFRRAIDKAGPDALKMLDESFVPAPSTLDRMTVVFLKGMDEKGAPAGSKGEQHPAIERNPALPGGIDLPFKVPSEVSDAVVILAFTEKFKDEKVRNTYMPLGVQKTDSANGKEYWYDKAASGSRDLGLYFPSETVMVLGPADGVALFVSKQTKDGKQPDGPLTASLKIAAEGGRHMIAGINLKQFGLSDPRKLDRASADMKSVEKELQTVLKAEAVAIGLAFNVEGTKFDVRATYKTDGEAKEAETAARAVAAHLRKQLDDPKKQLKAMLSGKPGEPKPRPIRDLPEAVLGLFGTGALNMVDDNLANPPIKTEGNELVASFEAETIGGAYVGAAAVGVGLLLPATQKVREAASRVQGENLSPNLSRIGAGLKEFEIVNTVLPTVAPRKDSEKKGKQQYRGAGLSWRVHILQHVGEDELFRKFNIREPWDSPNNKELIEKMPKIYISPLAAAKPGETYYKVLVGKGTLFEPGGLQSLSPRDIPDGPSNTILVVEGGNPVIWTKPDDVEFEADFDPKSLGMPDKPGINVLMADGSVRYIDLNKLSPETLKAASTRAGGDILGPDWFALPPFPMKKDNEAPAPKGKAPAGKNPLAVPPIQPIKPKK